MSTRETGSGSSASTARARRPCCGCWPGELPCEEGEIFIVRRICRIGYLKQDAGFDSERTVIEEARQGLRAFPGDGSRRWRASGKREGQQDPDPLRADPGTLHERYDGWADTCTRARSKASSPAWPLTSPCTTRRFRPSVRRREDQTGAGGPAFGEAGHPVPG